MARPRACSVKPQHYSRWATSTWSGVDEGEKENAPDEHPPTAPRQANSHPSIHPSASPCKQSGSLTPICPQRNLPSRGLFRPGPLLAGGAVLMLYGWYKLVKGIREQKYSPRRQSREDVSMLTPYPKANSPAKRCGPASTSSRSSRPKRTATSSGGTWLTRRERRTCWGRISGFITPIGEFFFCSDS